MGFIWLDNVYCIGFEERIEDCMYNGWGIFNCGYGEDVFVSCLLLNGMIFLMFV